MKGLNKAYIMGALTGTLDMRSTAGGLPVLHFSLSVEGLGGKPEVLPMTAQGANADFLHRCMGDGSKAALECRVRGNWLDVTDGVVHPVRLVVERIMWVQGERAPAAIEVVCEGEPPEGEF